MEKSMFVYSGVRTLVFGCLVLGAIFLGSVSVAMKATDQAAFCSSCHIMAEAAWTHSQSAHAKIACNECHVPANLVDKMPYKAASGFRDIYHNTFQEFADVVHATDATKDVVQENCRRCHTVTVSKVNMTAKQYCIDCHKSVPHRSKKPLSTRMAADV